MILRSCQICGIVKGWNIPNLKFFRSALWQVPVRGTWLSDHPDWYFMFFDLLNLSVFPNLLNLNLLIFCIAEASEHPVFPGSAAHCHRHDNQDCSLLIHNTAGLQRMPGFLDLLNLLPPCHTDDSRLLLVYVEFTCGLNLLYSWTCCPCHTGDSGSQLVHTIHSLLHYMIFNPSVRLRWISWSRPHSYLHSIMSNVVVMTLVTMLVATHS